MKKFEEGLKFIPCCSTMKRLIGLKRAVINAFKNLQEDSKNNNLECPFLQYYDVSWWYNHCYYQISSLLLLCLFAYFNWLSFILTTSFQILHRGKRNRDRDIYKYIKQKKQKGSTFDRNFNVQITMMSVEWYIYAELHRSNL